MRWRPWYTCWQPVPVASTDEMTETSTALPLFKAALRELPQMDSIYVGFENGGWLQVRLLSELNNEQPRGSAQPWLALTS